MPLQVLVVPDKFKGTLTAGAAARALAAGWRRSRPADQMALLPMSDGGDGFGEALGGLLDARARTVSSVDAAHRPCRVRWWFVEDQKLAVVESARVVGLAMLPRHRYHPFDLDTFGLGKVLVAAAAAGARRCILGIGGSATNDGGFGLARALGWQFFDRSGTKLTRWTDLARLATLRAPEVPRLAGLDLIVATDVRNRLLGRQGATRVYGPQKGIRPEDVLPAERSLRALAKAVRAIRRKDLAMQPGAGAAGGLGFGLMAFAGARVLAGFEIWARQARLPRRLRAAELVLTGEGALDTSTLMGKGVGEIGRRCAALGLPCLAFGGVVRDAPQLRRVFTRVRALTPDLTTRRSAQEQAARWLARLAEVEAARWPTRRRT